MAGKKTLKREIIEALQPIFDELGIKKPINVRRCKKQQGVDFCINIAEYANEYKINKESISKVRLSR